MFYFRVDLDTFRRTHGNDNGKKLMEMIEYYELVSMIPRVKKWFPIVNNNKIC